MHRAYARCGIARVRLRLAASSCYVGEYLRQVIICRDARDAPVAQAARVLLSSPVIHSSLHLFEALMVKVTLYHIAIAGGKW